MRSRKQLTLTLLALFAVGFSAAAIVFYLVVSNLAERAIFREIDIVRGSTLAIRGYTADEIRPLLAEQMETQFLPHSVPSFSAQTVFRRFQEKFPDFSYKEAVLNPTNPADKALGWEVDVINALRADPRLENISVERDTLSGRRLSIAYPIVIKKKSCLICHSDPDLAPETMIDLYGRDNGFAWKLNEIVGAQIISVPHATEFELIRGMMGSLPGIVALILLVIGIVVNILISRYLSQATQPKFMSAREARKQKQRR